MFRRLDRYILADIARVGLLSTGVLVVVIAFGATIRPLSKDSLLTAGQTLKYLCFAIVPMLQFALPFAAGFAGTMSLQRMAADNEILAAAVGGISYRRMLAPVLVLGLVLLVIMTGLTQWVIPRFWTLLEAAVAKDMTRIFQASIGRGEPFQFGDRQIFADRMVVEPDPGGEVDTRLILFRVAAADLDAEGRIDKEVTANRAVVDIYRRPDATLLKLAMADAVAFNPEDGVLAWAERLDSRTLVIPSVLRDDARNMTQPELFALYRNVDGYEEVLDVKLDLIEELRRRDVGAWIDEQLAAGDPVIMTARGSAGSRYDLRAGGLLPNGTLVPPSGGVISVVLRGPDGVINRRFEAMSGTLERRSTGPLDAPVCDLELTACTVIDLAAGGASNVRERIRMDGVTLDLGPEDEDLSVVPCDELLARVDAMDAPSSDLQLQAFRLRDRMEGVRDEVLGRLVKRYAMAMTAPLLLLLGATLAMYLRRSQPLVIYLIAFVPSVLDLLLISSGEHMVRDGRTAAGLAVLWSGNLVLLLAWLGTYWKLSQH